jgi:hypothetical protein
MVRSHSQELLAGPRLRTTCDRCHVQKLRCLKTVDQVTCIRCTKHKTSCTFSVRTQRKARALDAKDTLKERESTMPSPAPLLIRSSELSTTNSTSIASSPTIDAWAMDFNTLFATESLDSLSTLVGTQNSHFDVIRELANMNVALNDHFYTLPVTIRPGDSVRAADSQSPSYFAIDETFSLTNTFITLLKQLRISLNSPTNHGASIDHATTLLVLSCFHRFMDIYGSIANRTQACAQDPQMPLPGDQPAVRLPPLQLGSYVPAQLQHDGPENPISLSTISMHMMVVLTLSFQLCQQLREVISGGLDHISRGNAYTFGNMGPSLDADVPDMLVHRPSPMFNDQARLDIDQRWSALTAQFQTAKQAVVLCSAMSM